MKILPHVLIAMFLLGCSPSQSKMQKFAEDFVKERQVKWHDRTDHASSVMVGTKEKDVLKVMGEPDSKSDSDTTKNWLYWIVPNIKDGQVCIGAFILKVEAGVVVDRRLDVGLRQGIAEFY